MPSDWIERENDTGCVLSSISLLGSCLCMALNCSGQISCFEATRLATSFSLCCGARGGNVGTAAGRMFEPDEFLPSLCFFALFYSGPSEPFAARTGGIRSSRASTSTTSTRGNCSARSRTRQM